MKPSFPFVRNAYNYDRNLASDESGLRCDDVSLTKQSFAEEADINTIVRRFHLTGQLPENVRAPQYQDFEGVFDFHSAMNAVAAAGESFDAMPAEVRSRFHNNPAEFVDFCSDAANREEAVKLGLVFDRKLEFNGLRSKEGRNYGGERGVDEGGRFDVDAVRSGGASVVRPAVEPGGGAGREGGVGRGVGVSEGTEGKAG